MKLPASAANATRIASTGREHILLLALDKIYSTPTAPFLKDRRSSKATLLCQMVEIRSECEVGQLVAIDSDEDGRVVAGAHDGCLYSGGL